MPIHGTSWLRTVTNRFCWCSTLLCFRLCISALGTMSGCAVRNTAVPSTRAGGLTKTDSRKDFRSMEVSRSDWLSSSRPSFQVVISMKMAPPMRMGNQPPSTSLSMFEAKKVTSMAKKKPVAAMHSASG